MSFLILALALMQQGDRADTRVGPLGPPPDAAQVEGTIGQVVLAPIFAARFQCSEHAEGELEMAGDALGTDCAIVGGVEGETGFPALYRCNGRRNEDWYGWQAQVRAPIDGVVLGVRDNPVTNVPGSLGRPPAGTIRILTDDGIIVVLGHVTGFAVAGGARVKAGQMIGRVGNNGVSRSPHIHVGAYRAADRIPLQVRWDLRAMGQAQR